MDELRASEERYRALVELSPDGIVVIQDGAFVFANQRALDLVGAADLHELQRHGPLGFVPPAAQRKAINRYGALEVGDRLPYAATSLIRLSDQRSVPIETAAAGIEYEGRRAIMIVARDISGRFEAEQAMWSAEQRFAAAFREAPIAMLLIDPIGVVLDANPALGELVGDDPRGLVGRQSLRLVHRDDRDSVRTLLRSVAENGHPDEPLEWRLLRNDQRQVWVQGSVAPLPGEPRMLVLHLIDVTERRANEARLAHRALHDPLTGLPNRTLLSDRLAQAVRAAERDPAGGVAVLFVDLNNFKQINDTYGHAVGDQVLIEVAKRMRAAVRPADTVARLGGDEYAVVAEGLPAPDALALATRVHDALAEPIGELYVDASIGTAYSDAARLDPDALLRQADADMYRAKRSRQRSVKIAKRATPVDEPTDAA